MKKVVCIFLSILVLFQIVFAESADNDKYFIYNGFRLYEDQQTNKVSYSVKLDKNVNYMFTMDYYYNGKYIDTCQKDIILQDDYVFKKVTCEIGKLGDGEYIFDARITSDNAIQIETCFNKEILSESLDLKSNVKFKDLENDKTQIIINIEGSYKNILVKNNIPKDVIEKLTYENKDSYITSELNYEILNEDPLIAWNIKESPATINYTINKKLSSEQKKQISVEIVESKRFQFIKYVLLILIFVILYLTFKPIFKKNEKKKQ